MMVVPSGLIMARHHAISMLCKLPELILIVAVHPVMEHEHMVSGFKQNISLEHFVLGNFSADVRHGGSGVTRLGRVPAHRNVPRAILSVSVICRSLRIRDFGVNPSL